MRRFTGFYLGILLLLDLAGPAWPPTATGPQSGCARADTFTNRSTGQVLHGYAVSAGRDGKTLVQTVEKGPVELNLAAWSVVYDRHGRKNTVVVLPIDGAISTEIQTDALIEALRRACRQGPLLVLIEIDTPGGRVDYTRRMCGAIAETRACRVFALITNGRYGGAISAGAAVALACDRIYMRGGTTIGAAATVGLSKSGVKDFKQIYGEEIAEKINSAWRTYLAGLAEFSNRPGLLACAMVDDSVEVVEVLDNHRKLFIDPADRTADQEIVRTWSKKGSLLTLTAEEAVECGIADGVVESRSDLLRRLGAPDANVVVDDAFAKARRRLERARARFTSLSNSLDLRLKQIKGPAPEVRTLKLLRDIRDDYRSLLTLARLYPDLHADANFIQKQLNSAQALYEQARMAHRPLPR